MTTTASATTLNPTRSRYKLNAADVLSELERLHATLGVGEQFPSHRELVRRIGAPERSIAWALEELARQGKIIKRLGRGGSVVADPNQAVHHNGSTPHVELSESTL